jgi:hypothetical protein
MGVSARRKRRKSGDGPVVARLERRHPPSAPPAAKTRPPLTVPPGETRYRKQGGLRARLQAAAEEGEELHVSIDIRELRARTVIR